MSIKWRLKQWKLNAKGSKMIPSMTSEEVLRQRNIVVFDDDGSMKTTERQKDNITMPKADRSAAHCKGPRLSGHLNLLFCCDDNEHHDNEGGAGVARFRIECGREFGGHGKDTGQLQDATDIQYLEKGQVLVTDLVNSRLQIFEEAGTVKTIYQSDEVLEPWASAMTPDGRHVAVTSRKLQKVVLLARREDGGGIRGSVGEGHLSCPSGLAVTAQGDYIVTDIATHKVSVFNPDGTFFKHLGGGAVTFHQPRYVTVSQQGDVIVSDSGHHRLVVFSKDWKFVRTIGSFGKEDGNFKFPHGVCTDTLGNILACDRYNNRVSAFTRRGEFVRHMLTSQHQLRHPQGLALSPERDLYISHGGLKAQKIKVVHIVVRAV